MSDPPNLLEHDLQASPPEVRIALSRAGVTGVNKAIRIRHAESEKLIAARIDCTVDLDPERKGVHMSRFPSLFEEAIDEVVIGEAFLVEDLAEHIARHIVERQRAGRAEVTITAAYPLERRTPVTQLATQEMVSIVGLAAATADGVRRIVGVEATGINACPCAQGLVRGRSAERLREAGFDELDVERILELVPLATHNQRGRGTLYVGTRARVNAEQLVRIVESSMSSPVYELLKRPDELFVVEHAHLQPRFVEDSVRLALKGALDAYPELDDGDFLLARQLNFETIHNHDVVAERYGTAGELRAELRPGPRPAVTRSSAPGSPSKTRFKMKHCAAGPRWTARGSSSVASSSVAPISQSIWTLPASLPRTPHRTLRRVVILKRVRTAAVASFLALALAVAGSAADRAPVTGWLGWGGANDRHNAAGRAGPFGPRWSLQLDGRVTAQPVVVRGVPARGQLTVYVGTSGGSLYAISGAGRLRWRVRFGRLQHRCGFLDGYGVTGTPAVDADARILYVADAFGMLHALDLDDGDERSGWPVRVLADQQREHVFGGLLVARDSVYVPAASYCDVPMEGKLVRVQTANRRVSRWISVPFRMGGGGGIWGFGGSSVQPPPRLGLRRHRQRVRRGPERSPALPRVCGLRRAHRRALAVTAAARLEPPARDHRAEGPRLLERPGARAAARLPGARGGDQQDRPALRLAGGPCR